MKRGYAPPSPLFIKPNGLLRNGLPNATWVETETFLGQTTQLLTKYSVQGNSIEPESKLFARVHKLFSKHGNVEILNGTSEDVFPSLSPRIMGDVNFWLDGLFGWFHLQGAERHLDTRRTGQHWP